MNLVQAASSATCLASIASSGSASHRFHTPASCSCAARAQDSTSCYRQSALVSHPSFEIVVAVACKDRPRWSLDVGCCGVGCCG